MNEARFMTLLSAYGAELARWPEDERAAAEALLEVAPHRVKDIWESERAFDHLLALEKDVPASIALETKVLSTALGRRSAPRPAPVLARWKLPQWATGGAIAASLALGFAVGYAGEPQKTPPEAGEYAKMLTINGAGAGSMFLAALADPET